jgi:hypothetical protein
MSTVDPLIPLFIDPFPLHRSGHGHQSKRPVEMIAANAALTETNAALTEELEAEKGKLEQVNTELAGANKQLENLATIQSQKDDLSQRLADMEVALETARNDINERDARLVDMEAENEHLLEIRKNQAFEIKDLKEEKEAKNTLILRLNNHIRKLKNSLEEEERNVISFRVQIRAIRDESRASRRDIDQLRLENGTMKEGKHRYILERAENFRQVNMLTQEIPRLQREKHEAVKDMLKSQKALDVVKNTSQRMQQRHQIQREESNQYISKLTSQLNLLVRAKLTEHRNVIKEAKLIGTLPKPEKGMTKMNAEMKRAIQAVKKLVASLGNKFEESASALLVRLHTVENAIEEGRQVNEAKEALLVKTMAELGEAQDALDPIKVELEVEREGVPLHVEAGVQAALAKVKMEKAKEEEEAKARELSTRLGVPSQRFRPASAPPGRSYVSRPGTAVYGQTATRPGAPGFNFWGQVR